MRPPVRFNDPEIRLIAGQPLTVLASLRQDLEPQSIDISAPEGLDVSTEPVRGRIFKLHLEWNEESPGSVLELAFDVAGERQTIPVIVAAN